MFWFILVTFVTLLKTMAGLHLTHRFGPKMKRRNSSGQKRKERTQSTFLDPILMFWFVLVTFVTVLKIMLGLHLMHRFGPKMKRCTSSGQKQKERTKSTFLDLILMFWFVLVTFVTVLKTMPGCIKCTGSGRK